MAIIEKKWLEMETQLQKKEKMIVVIKGKICHCIRSNDGKQIKEAYLIDIIIQEIERIRNKLKIDEENVQSVHKGHEN